jgi:hypothetical protein
MNWEVCEKKRLWFVEDKTQYLLRTQENHEKPIRLKEKEGEELALLYFKVPSRQAYKC